MTRFALILALLPLALGAATDDGLDPVVADVVRMLGEGVDPGIISSWLDSSGAVPGELSPDDLVALARAEAPESLVRKLLERAEAPPPSPTPIPAPEGEPAPAGERRVEFTVDYRPLEVDRRDKWDTWGLYVYLDGRPLTWSGGGSTVFSFSTKVLRFYEALEPGRHVIRVLQERHELQSKKSDRWSHEARVYPGEIVFEMDGEGEFRVDLKVNENTAFWKKEKGPVSYTILRDGALVATVDGDGPLTDDWPALCDDVEVGIPEDKMDSRTARRALDGCVRWQSMWSGVENVPDRDTVRGQLAEYDYRPVPTSVRKGN